MTEKVLCPYCGAEMEICGDYCPFGEGHIGYTVCVECGAYGPLGRSTESVKNAKAVARAAALSRYTPPLRPMTLEEATKTEENVWYEYYGSTRAERIDCVELPQVKAYTEICTLRRDNAWLVTSELYGKTWRCWPRKPTQEEMKAAKWDGGLKNAD